jgi:hypothetical protein
MKNEMNNYYLYNKNEQTFGIQGKRESIKKPLVEGNFNYPKIFFMIKNVSINFFTYFLYLLIEMLQIGILILFLSNSGSANLDLLSEEGLDRNISQMNKYLNYITFSGNIFNQIGVSFQIYSILCFVIFSVEIFSFFMIFFIGSCVLGDGSSLGKNNYRKSSFPIPNLSPNYLILNINLKNIVQ